MALSFVTYCCRDAGFRFGVPAGTIGLETI
jgi:hypothetical protein